MVREEPRTVPGRRQVLATSEFCGPERQGSCSYHQCWRLNRTGFVLHPPPELEEEPPWGARSVHSQSAHPATHPPAALLLRWPSLLHTESNRTFRLLCTVLVLVFAKRMFLNRSLHVTAVILGSPPNLRARPPPQASPSGPQTVTSVKLAISGTLTCEMNAVTRTGRG